MSLGIARRILMHYATMEKILGGKQVLHKNIKSKKDLIILGTKGVSKNALLSLMEHLKLTIPQMAVLLSISKRSIYRYSPQQPFNRYISEHILLIAEVVVKGSEVFRDIDTLRQWLNLPNKALGNELPINLLNSSFGIEMLMQELGRIEHGIIA